VNISCVSPFGRHCAQSLTWVTSSTFLLTPLEAGISHVTEEEAGALSFVFFFFFWLEKNFYSFLSIEVVFPGYFK
jgi:hypothetical protein